MPRRAAGRVIEQVAEQVDKKNGVSDTAARRERVCHTQRSQNLREASYAEALEAPPGGSNSAAEVEPQGNPAPYPSRPNPARRAGRFSRVRPLCQSDFLGGGAATQGIRIIIDKVANLSQEVAPPAPTVWWRLQRRALVPTHRPSTSRRRKGDVEGRRRGILNRPAVCAKRRRGFRGDSLSSNEMCVVPLPPSLLVLVFSLFKSLEADGCTLAFFTFIFTHGASTPYGRGGTSTHCLLTTRLASLCAWPQRYTPKRRGSPHIDRGGHRVSAHACRAYISSSAVRTHARAANHQASWATIHCL